MRSCQLMAPGTNPGYERAYRIWGCRLPMSSRRGTVRAIKYKRFLASNRGRGVRDSSAKAAATPPAPEPPKRSIDFALTMPSTARSLSLSDGRAITKRPFCPNLLSICFLPTRPVPAKHVSVWSGRFGINSWKPSSTHRGFRRRTQTQSFCSSNAKRTQNGANKTACVLYGCAGLLLNSLLFQAIPPVGER
jgi:hypothetical protein